MIKHFRSFRKMYESLNNSVPRSENDLIAIAKHAGDSSYELNDLIVELKGKPFTDLYPKRSLRVILRFMEEYYIDTMSLIELDSWKFAGIFNEDNWSCFDYYNSNTEISVSVGLLFDEDSRILYAYAEDDEFNELDGFSISLPSYRDYTSQAEYVIAICDRIASNLSKFESFTKKVLYRLTRNK